jgi:hypothetical protein
MIKNVIKFTKKDWGSIEIRVEGQVIFTTLDRSKCIERLVYFIDRDRSHIFINQNLILQK